MSHEKIVTLFDTLQHAEAAERNLIKAGFSEYSISIIRHQDIDPEDLDTEQSIWQKLFGEKLTDEDRQIYSEAIRNNGTVLTIHVDDDERAKALAILNRHQLSDESRYQRANAPVQGTLVGTEAAVTAHALHTPTSQRPYLTGDESHDEILQLAKEELEIGKRIEKEGSKHIRRYVVESDVTKSVNLREQHAEVLRRNVNRPVTDKNIDWSDKEISVEEFAEKPVVNKNARIVEEVVVKKVNTDHDETVHGTVREQKVEVDGRPVRDPNKTF